MWHCKDATILSLLEAVSSLLIPAKSREAEREPGSRAI